MIIIVISNIIIHTSAKEIQIKYRLGRVGGWIKLDEMSDVTSDASDQPRQVGHVSLVKLQPDFSAQIVVPKDSRVAVCGFVKRGLDRVDGRRVTREQPCKRLQGDTVGSIRQGATVHHKDGTWCMYVRVRAPKEARVEHTHTHTQRERERERASERERERES